MKKCFIIILLIYSFNRAAFENLFIDANTLGSGGAAVASRNENCFIINPANIKLHKTAYISLSTYIANTMLAATQEYGARLFSRFAINGNNALAFAGEYTAFPYQGDYPGLNNILWDEIRAVLAYNYLLNKTFSCGISGTFCSYFSDFTLHNVKAKRTLSGDFSLGCKVTIQNYNIGLSFNNILQLNNGVCRFINLGFSSEKFDYNIEEYIIINGDISFNIDLSSVNLRLGTVFTFGKFFNFNAGLMINDMFKAGITPTAGITFLLKKSRFSYAFSYNTRIGGYGNHYLNYGLLLDKKAKSK
ncbi:MAG TPA: hypothetical protein VKS21_09870 [Spirochaetota bacterium]|nr:hypothetical protein [Spirochaetota bacterium]